MESEESKVQKALQIKGYKYRAKMIIAALVVLIVIIAIIIFIINGISSAINDKDDENKTSDTDTEQITSVSEQSSSLSSSTDYYSENSTTSFESSSNNSENYNFDLDQKLIIDTDTLDGKKAVAITFDDGPGEYTERLINELNKRDVKATFFMLGSCVSEYPEVLPMMVEGGHQIGSHTFDHTDITSLSNQKFNEQISKTDEAIYNACGQTATAFRPPYGSYTEGTISSIDKTITLWSLDSRDWELRNADAIKEEIVSKCHDGDIILLHDIYSTSVDGALAAIDELQSQGFVFVTVDELISRYGYDVNHGDAYFSQFAVYETNSPYAEKYESEMAASAANEAAASASTEFYYDSSSTNNSASKTSSQSASSASNEDIEKDESKLIY